MFRLELPGLGLGLRLGVFFLKHSNMQMMRVVGFEHSFLHAPLNFLSSPGYLNSDGRMSRANITMVAYLIFGGILQTKKAENRNNIYWTQT